MVKRALLWILMAAGCLAIGARGWAGGLADNYDVVSPGIAKDIVYVCQEPLFKISAPKSWYMASVLEEGAADRVIFFKTDPRKILAEGDIPMPNIRVSFEENPDHVPAWMKTAELAGNIRTDGGKFLLEPETIMAGKKKGHHLTALDPVSRVVMDIYIFQKDGLIIRVMAVCSDVEFKGLMADIKKTIDSIVL
jgi:hypothetical protein